MPEPTSGIFISYRRESSAALAGRLYDSLAGKLGKEHVFIDTDTIEPGEDFIEVLDRKLAHAVALIVVIGRDWLTCKDADGIARLANPDDFVRLEIATALNRKVRVIPLLFDGARVPSSQDLPPDLASLSRRQAIEIDHGRFHQDAAKLIEVCEKLLKAAPVAEPVPPTSPAPRRAGETEVNPKDGLTYVWIPPGSFTMGCSPGDNECFDNEKPAHQVTITKGFWLSQTPVTQAAYERVKGNNPSDFKGDNRPVDSVTWNDAVEYCRAIGGRLPTEAEWEYAALAGTAGSRYGNLDDIAWYDGNGGGQTHEMGQKKPNAWGLYDMLGNVWQWTADWSWNYSGAEQSDPQGASNGQYRALRGGSWNNDPRHVRASNRYRYGPAGRSNNIGFRCVWQPY